MIKAFGPEKLFTKHDDELMEIIRRINDEIEAEYGDSVHIYTYYEWDRFKNRLINIYKDAGWSRVSFEENGEGSEYFFLEK